MAADGRAGVWSGTSEWTAISPRLPLIPPLFPRHWFHPPGPGSFLFHTASSSFPLGAYSHVSMYHRVHTCVRLCVPRVYVCDARVCVHVRSCASSGVVLRAKRYGRTVTETRTAHRTHCSRGLPPPASAVTAFPCPPPVHVRRTPRTGSRSLGSSRFDFVVSLPHVSQFDRGYQYRDIEY